jgi:hypothetical protein
MLIVIAINLTMNKIDIYSPILLWYQEPNNCLANNIKISLRLATELSHYLDYKVRSGRSDSVGLDPDLNPLLTDSPN